MPTGDDRLRPPRLAATCPAGCDCPELSHVLHRILDSVASGQILVVTAQERRLLHRVESALAAFEAGWGVFGAERSHHLAPE